MQADLINKIKEAKFFSKLADEVESHKVEQLPICIWFVDKNNNIRDKFLEFGRCEQLSGKVIANEIIRVLEKSNLDIKNCNMSSEAVGVQKQIKKLCEKAVYTHCCGHNLNLVITTACKSPMIQNALDIVKEVTMMFVMLKFGKYISLNPFLPNVSFLYILKILENKIFLMYSVVIKRGHWEEMG